MNKILRYYLVVVGLLLLSFGSSISVAQNTWGKDYMFEQNTRLGRGVNILSADPIWRDVSEARITEKHFKLIKEVGFDNVRIVIKPFKFSLNDVDYTIDSSFFTTLDWAINQALSHNLMAIVDFHEHHAMGENPQGNKAKFLSMWKQIAKHYTSAPKM